jgi:hypothetical protein
LDIPMKTVRTKRERSGQNSKPAKTKKRFAAARGAKPSAAAEGEAGVLVVNIIPKSLSFETGQDSEPMIAVNPANPNNIVATAFTSDPLSSGFAPYFLSKDGGRTWTLNSVVPGGDMTGDITVAFSGSADKLYAGILRRDSPSPFVTRMNILRTDDFTSTTAMDVLDDRQQPDQPFAQATTVSDGANAGKERVYVGSNDFAASPQTATIDVSLDAGTSAPFFNKVRIEHRSTASAGQDGPQIRPIIHPDGTIYAAFYGWRSNSGDWNANTLQVTADVVVVRDDQWGAGTSPFQALTDPGDGLAGLRVATAVQFAFNRTGLPTNGQQRMGGTLSIAVDPRGDHSGTVYLAFGTDEPTTGFTIHLRSTNDRGVTWSPDLLTLPRATNAAVAINSDGIVGLLYQQLTGVDGQQRWETHLRRSSDGISWSDLVLANTPAASPNKTFDPYLGDYDHLVAVDKNFYGIFSANNTPDQANFPNGVVYQRNADFNSRHLLNLDNVTTVPASIDPFFFKASG